MQHVATIRLDDILAHVPQRLLWDDVEDRHPGLGR